MEEYWPLLSRGLQRRPSAFREFLDTGTGGFCTALDGNELEVGEVSPSDEVFGVLPGGTTPTGVDSPSVGAAPSVGERGFGRNRGSC